MKKFIKPTKEKIILAFALALVFVPFIEAYRPIICIANTSCPQSVGVSILSFLLRRGIFVGISWIFLLFGLVITYLTSCLLVWLVDYWKSHHYSWNWIKKIIFGLVSLLIIAIISFMILVFFQQDFPPREGIKEMQKFSIVQPDEEDKSVYYDEKYNFSLRYPVNYSLHKNKKWQLETPYLSYLVISSPATITVIDGPPISYEIIEINPSVTPAMLNQILSFPLPTFPDEAYFLSQEFREKSFYDYLGMVENEDNHSVFKFVVKKDLGRKSAPETPIFLILDNNSNWFLVFCLGRTSPPFGGYVESFECENILNSFKL